MIAGEPVSERDHILQLLRRLGLEYNPIVASLTAKEDDLPVQSVQSILLMHEQRLQSQESFSVTEYPIANVGAHTWQPQERRYQPRSSFPPT